VYAFIESVLAGYDVDDGSNFWWNVSYVSLSSPNLSVFGCLILSYLSLWLRATPESDQTWYYLVFEEMLLKTTQGNFL